MRRSLLIVAAIALSWSPWSTTAYPNKAGDCPEGTKAVGGDHLSSSAIHGSLPGGGFEISINGDVLSRSTSYIVEPGVNHDITLSGSNQFIGFLIRLGSGSSNIDTTSALSSSSSDAQLADVCVDDYSVGGICHTNPTSLGEISGTLRLEEESDDMLLDITVVVSFDPSEYYHSTYTIHSRAGGSPVAPSAPVTPAPVAPPTTPSAPVTSAPVAPPTTPSAPVTPAPVAPPTTPDTPAPVVPTGGSAAPVVAPSPVVPTGGSAAPVVPPSAAPVPQTSTPSTLGTKYDPDTSAPSVVSFAASDGPSLLPSVIPTTVAEPTTLAVPPTAPTPGTAAVGGLQSSTHRQCSSSSVGLILLLSAMMMMWML